MISYIVQSSLCLSVFLVIYHFCLANERMFSFNRFYLLGSLLFSLSVPVLEIELSLQTEILPPTVYWTPAQIISLQNEAVISHANNEETPIWKYLQIAYVGVMFLLLAKSFVQVLYLLTLSHKNPVVNYKRAVLVLIPNQVVPHSFGHYIYVNRGEYKAGKIDLALLEHEWAHVKQQHSIDIIIIQILKAIFWFNPLIHFYEAVIKLNHEFLADAAVCTKGQDIRTYQDLLINVSAGTQLSAIGSAANFQVTKKRFIMMTKTSPSWRKALKQFALLPVVGAVFIFTATVHSGMAQVSEEKNDAVSDMQKRKYSETDSLWRVKYLYWKGAKFSMKLAGQDEKGSFKKVEEMTREEVLALPNPKPLPSKMPSQQQLDEWLDTQMYGVWLDGKKIANAELKNYSPEDLQWYSISKLMKNAVNYGKHVFQVDVSTVRKYEYQKDLFYERVNIHQYIPGDSR